MDNFKSRLTHHHIYGIGSDICDITRITNIYKNFGDSFLRKTFSDTEISIFHQSPDIKKMPFLAKRFAAKEAVVKAMQTGFGQHAFMTDISTVSCADTGKPQVIISGRARETIDKISANKGFEFFISLSDEQDYALAFCIFALVRTDNKE